MSKPIQNLVINIKNEIIQIFHVLIDKHISSVWWTSISTDDRHSNSYKLCSTGLFLHVYEAFLQWILKNKDKIISCYIDYLLSLNNSRVGDYLFTFHNSYVILELVPSAVIFWTETNSTVVIANRLTDTKYPFLIWQWIFFLFHRFYPLSPTIHLPDLTMESNKLGVLSDLTMESNKLGVLSDLTTESNKLGVLSDLTMESNKLGVLSDLTMESNKLCVLSA